jgi:hypothetical protein
MLRALIALTLCFPRGLRRKPAEPDELVRHEREERIAVTEVGTPRPIRARWWPRSRPRHRGHHVRRHPDGHRPDRDHGLLAAGASCLSSRAEGIATYEFRAAPPPEGAVPGPEPTRQIVAAAELSRGDLQGLRSITVIARTNRRTVERR